MPPSQNFPRGARPSTRHALLGARPFEALLAPPPQFAVVPKQLSMEGNSQYGDCVSAEEAYAKAVWSLACGLPELKVPDQTTIDWARRHGFLNGADLSEVMAVMARTGFVVNGVEYRDGSPLGVDYSNEAVLQSAVAAMSPVKIAIDADALPSGAGQGNGWFDFSGGRYTNTDHCVAISGYGPAGWAFQQLGHPLPPGVSPNQTAYHLYTWGSIGVVSHPWLMGTCTEAWVRNPTTVGQVPLPPGPTPSPPPPPGPTPNPPPPPPPGPNPLPPRVVISQVIDRLSADGMKPRTIVKNLPRILVMAEQGRGVEEIVAAVEGKR